ncbi:hypothetical protein Daus18300_002836 [Diaporthe australafricana]|uniref:DNA (cytosine-5-)-methyltransferase n=1 Tax=Diaporthe australafricana TaxID=127596 RepID=A0ABR3XKM2_9PEZI
MSTLRKMAGSEEVETPGGSQQQPIKVSEDHDIPQSGIGRQVEEIIRRVQKGDARFNPIDLDGEDENLSEDPWRADEDNYDNDNAKIEREELAIEPDEIQDGPCVHWKKGIRNPCPCGTHHQVLKAIIASIELSKFQVVELKESVRVGRYEAEFIEIHEIWVPYKGEQSFIRGRAYARTRNLEGRIEPRKNELCEIYEIDANDHRASNPAAYLEQALVEIAAQNIKTVRTLHKTNKAFPKCRFDPIRYRTREEREDEAPLTCRWQMVLSYPDHRYRRQQRPIDGEEVRHYSHDDIPKDRHRVPDNQRRNKALGKIRGGSFVPNGAIEADPEGSQIKLAPGQKYTVVDVFSGAGGYSAGAEMAGLKVLAACDHWPRCCETYRQNFPGAELHEKDVYKYIEEQSTDLTCEHPVADILHFSPPCQTWSPAHTCEGKKDEANRATLFACEKIITIFHPRIFTVEQTFGLAQDRWIPSFNALLQGFTRHGYSVKWKVIHLVQFGLPQTRKRLVMIGAAPGEQLPAWPKPTHSKDPKDGQKPLVSALKACSDLIEGENLHDVEGARPADKIPWDGSKPLERTITTSGGQCYHWSGERDLTLAEFAALQGFPSFFRFVGKCIKKQIGNAFPPVVVKTLLKSVRVHLEKFDGVTRLPAPDQTILVSDDDSDDEKDSRPELRLKDQSQALGRLAVQDLGDFSLETSGMSRELLQGMIQNAREYPVQCFLAKTNRKSSKGDSSPGSSLRRSSRRTMSQAQGTRRNTLDLYFSLADQEPRTAQDVIAGVPHSPCQNPVNISDIPVGQNSTSGQAIASGANITHSQTITPDILGALTYAESSNFDEPKAHRNSQTGHTIACLNTPFLQAPSRIIRSTANQSATIAQTTAVPPRKNTAEFKDTTPYQTPRTITDYTMPSKDPETAKAIARLIEAARRSTIYPGLAEALEAMQAGDEGAAAAASPQDGTPTPHQAARTSQGGGAEGATAGPSRRSSGGGSSVAYVGQSARAGARRSLPIAVEDDEEEDGGDEQAKQADVQGFDPKDTALAMERSMQDARRFGRSHEQEDQDAAMGEAPPPEREMYGPGDYKGKGKGKQVAPRSFDEYDEDEEAQREGRPSKRSRGRK